MIYQDARRTDKSFKECGKSLLSETLLYSLDCCLCNQRQMTQLCLISLIKIENNETVWSPLQNNVSAQLNNRLNFKQIKNDNLYLAKM